MIWCKTVSWQWDIDRSKFKTQRQSFIHMSLFELFNHLQRETLVQVDDHWKMRPSSRNMAAPTLILHLPVPSCTKPQQHCTEMLESVPLWYLLFPGALLSHHFTRQVNTTSAYKVGQRGLQMCNKSSIVQQLYSSSLTVSIVGAEPGERLKTLRIIASLQKLSWRGKLDL